MVFSRIKGFFGGAAGESAASDAPFSLGLGRAVAFDTLRFRLEEGRLARGLPPETLVISAHGIASLDAAGLLHRFYNDDNAMLQVLCSGGTGDGAIQEITLYHPWDEVVPTTAAEWAVWDGPDGRIGAQTFEADGFRFERVWGQPETPWVPPAEFTEEVSVEGGPVRHLHHKIMPYRRLVGPLVETLIISVERDLASSDRGSVTFMIGYGLAMSDVNPV